MRPQLDVLPPDARRRGLLTHEVEQASATDRTERLAALRKGTSPTGTLYARDPSGPPTDYEQLTAEILARVVELEQEYAIS